MNRRSYIKMRNDPVRWKKYLAKIRAWRRIRAGVEPMNGEKIVRPKFDEAQYHRNYYLANKQKIIVRTKQWKSDNPEKVVASNKRSRAKNYAKIQAYWLSEKGRASCKKYKAGLSVEARRRAANKAMRKMREKPMFRILSNLRGRLCKIMSGQLKAASTMQLIGMSRDEFRKHLESQFSGGMSWENYGAIKGSDTMKWHVDHIVPCARFNMSDPMQQKACWHYTNLRPMWGLENISRNRRVAA